MNNEPVAWLLQTETSHQFTFKEPTIVPQNVFPIPLYTHPANRITEIIEKNKPEIEKVNAYIKSLENEIGMLKAKTLTDEEIVNIGYHYGELGLNLEMIRAILKKASEK